MARWIHLGLILCLIGCCGCGDKREAHLERFRGQAEVTKTADIKPIDLAQLSSSPAVADHISQMPFAEVAARLGAHRFQCDIDVEFLGQEERVSFSESDLIVLAQNGDFRVKVDNDRGQGYEAVQSDGHFYMRNRYDPFHERDTLTGDYLQWRDEAHQGWASIYRLFRGQLSFSRLGPTRHHGRDAVRFSISLGPKEPRLPGFVPPPEPPPGVTQYVYPIKPTPADRDRYRDLARPSEARGTLVCDAQTGVVLQVEFSGRLSLQPPKENRPISISVSARCNADGFGNPPSISPPPASEIKPIPSRNVANTNPLDFYFGKGFTATIGPAAGVAAPPEEKKKDSPSDKEPNPGGPASKPPL